MTKKTLIGGLLAVAFALLLFAPMVARADPAVVIKDFICVLIDGDGDFVIGTGTISVTTSSGVSNYVCKASGVANDTGSAVKWNFDDTGLLCGTELGATDDWSETVSASGNATLTCKFHP
jgi:hypothetical protein